MFSQLTVRYREFASFRNSFKCVPIFHHTQAYLELRKSFQSTYQKTTSHITGKHYDHINYVKI